MNLCEFQRIYCLARRNLAGVLSIGLIGLGCWRVAAQEPSKPDEVPQRPETASSKSDAEPLWQEQMHDAWSAMNQKDYGMAEQSCKEALKTAAQFGPHDERMTTNLIFLAGVYQMEKEPDLAEKSFHSAIASCAKAVGPDGADLVWPLEKLANFYYFAEHRYDLAAPVCLRILHIVEKASPRDSAEVIKRARAVAAVYRIQDQYAKAEPFYQETLAVAGTNEDELPDCLLTTAGFYHDWGKYQKAESLCQQALAIRERAAAANPGTESQMNLAISLYGLAENYRGWGRLNEAEKFYRQSEAIVEKASGPDSSELARPLSGLAATLADQGKTNEAAALYQRAFAVTENNLEPGNSVVEDVLHEYTALLDRMNRSGEANTLRQSYQWRVLMYGSSRALRLNNLADAERLAAEALKLAGAFGSNDVRLSQSQVQMAGVYRQQGKEELAEQTYQEAIASCEKAVGPKSRDLILPLQNLANFYYYTKVRYDQVATLYQRILDIVQAAPVPDPMEVAQWERDLADVYHLANQNAKAESLYQKALASAESATNTPAGETVQYLQSLGDFYWMTGRCDQAEPVLKRALAIREQTLASAPDNPDAELDVAVCCDYLGQTYLAWNQPAQAELFYRRSLGIVEKVSGDNSTDLSPRLMGLAKALRAQKKYPEAESQYKRALEIAEKGFGPDAPQVADVLDQYATLLADMNKTQDAKNMRDWADSLRKENATQTE
ncbi:MAG: tetratricopeptide repeat protein [Verrucomicrobiia bacterium]